MLLSLSLVFNVVLVVVAVSLFKKWWETDDDLERCETRLERYETRLEEHITRHDELYKAYSDLCDGYYDLSERYSNLLEQNIDLVESNISLSEELLEFQDRTVKAFRQLKNELQDREDLIANLFEEMEELEVNIEGSEEFVPEQVQDVDDSYTVEEETDVESEEDFESIEIDSLADDLELDDFNDEH